MLSAVRKAVVGLAIGACISLTACGGGGSSTSAGGNSGQPQPSAFTVTGGNNQSAAVGTALPTALSVQVTGSSGQPLEGVAVSWAVTAGGGSLAKVSATTDSTGTAQAQWTIGTAAGANTATATVTVLTPVTFSATGTPGPLAAMTLTNPQNPLLTGNVVQIGVNAVDQYGNATSGGSPTWSASPPSVASISASGQVTAVAPGAGFVTATSGSINVTLPIVVNGDITFSLGAEEVVFSYETQRCADSDVPDETAKAVHLTDGSLLLTASNAPNNYGMFGSDFSTLTRSCTAPILSSDVSPDADTFDNEEWMTSPYRVGNTIYALIHNEFHDPVAANCSPGNPLPGNPCWYNSILSFSSTDGGQTFTHATPPAQVVAPPAAQWNAGPPTPAPYGYFNPSNIVLSSDGNYYDVFMAIDTSGSQGMCVMRTQTLDDPTSWRAWDGSGFNLQMTDPYTGPAPQWCTQVIQGGLPGSLTFNTYLNAYVLMSDIFTPVGCGTVFVTSTDLVHWSAMSWLRAAYSPPSLPGQTTPCGAPAGVASIAYSSFIDPADTTVNFEQPGQTPYLYYTRFNPTGGSLNRDLVRVPVTITAH